LVRHGTRCKAVFLCPRFRHGTRGERKGDETLDPKCTLESVANVLALICEALLGRPVTVRSDGSGVRDRVGADGADDEGRTIYLPPVVPEFRLFKLMALHRAVMPCHGSAGNGGRHGMICPPAGHLEADRFLLTVLPGLRRDMEAVTEGGLPPSYPAKAPEDASGFPPWWGEFLAPMGDEADSVVRNLAQMGEEKWGLSADVLEQLLSSMAENGERDQTGLWRRMNELIQELQLPSPFEEKTDGNFRAFSYREWDSESSRYKPNWCRVRERRPGSEPNRFVEEVRRRLSGVIAHTRRQFSRLKPEEFRKLREQASGDDIDLDAVIRAIVDSRSGSSPSDAVYVRRDKRIRDLAVLLLMDASVSTEEQVDGRRVIDIEKEAMVLMTEALNSIGDRYAIFGFQSEGRFSVDALMIKDFEETYGEEIEYRLGNMEPGKQTRLGAVIRHAAFRLAATAAATKLMIVLTDGRPYDMDYGDSDYALQDTKKAFEEARRSKIKTFIITSDQQGADYLKLMAPESRSIVLTDVRLLPGMLPMIYKRLTT